MQDRHDPTPRRDPSPLGGEAENLRSHSFSADPARPIVAPTEFRSPEEYRIHERVADGVVRKYITMPPPPWTIDYVKDLVFVGGLPALDHIRAVCFSLSDTLMVLQPRCKNADPSLMREIDRSALREALTISGIDPTNPSIDVDRIGQLLSSPIQRPPASRQHNGQIVYPAVHEPSVLGALLGSDNPLLAVHLSAAFDMLRFEFSLAPGAAEFLEILRRAGISRGILCNSKAHTPSTIDQLFLRDQGYPVRCVVDEDLCLYSHRSLFGGMSVQKPTPGLFESFYCSARRLLPNLRREEVLFIGGRADIDAPPSDSGFRFVLVSLGQESGMEGPRRHLGASVPQRANMCSSYQQLWHAMGLRLE